MPSVSVRANSQATSLSASNAVTHRLRPGLRHRLRRAGVDAAVGGRERLRGLQPDADAASGRHVEGVRSPRELDRLRGDVGRRLHLEPAGGHGRALDHLQPVLADAAVAGPHGEGAGGVESRHPGGEVRRVGGSAGAGARHVQIARDAAALIPQLQPGGAGEAAGRPHADVHVRAARDVAHRAGEADERQARGARPRHLLQQYVAAVPERGLRRPRQRRTGQDGDRRQSGGQAPPRRLPAHKPGRPNPARHMLRAAHHARPQRRRAAARRSEGQRAGEHVPRLRQPLLHLQRERRVRQRPQHRTQQQPHRPPRQGGGGQAEQRRAGGVGQLEGAVQGKAAGRQQRQPQQQPSQPGAGRRQPHQPAQVGQPRFQGVQSVHRRLQRGSL